MIVYRVYRDADKNNWIDYNIAADAIANDLGHGYEHVSIIDWSKEAYMAEVNQLHEQLFASYYSQRDYQSREEIALWVNHPEYGGEATALIAWYWLTWDLIKAHEAQVTEAKANAQQFISNLPIFVYG